MDLGVQVIKTGSENCPDCGSFSWIEGSHGMLCSRCGCYGFDISATKKHLQPCLYRPAEYYSRKRMTINQNLPILETEGGVSLTIQVRPEVPGSKITEYIALSD